MKQSALTVSKLSLIMLLFFTSVTAKGGLLERFLNGVTKLFFTEEQSAIHEKLTVNQFTDSDAVKGALTLKLARVPLAIELKKKGFTNLLAIKAAASDISQSSIQTLIDLKDVEHFSEEIIIETITFTPTQFKMLISLKRNSFSEKLALLAAKLLTVEQTDTLFLLRNFGITEMQMLSGAQNLLEFEVSRAIQLFKDPDLKNLFSPDQILKLAKLTDEQINLFKRSAESKLNVAFVEVNDNALANVGCFVRSDNNKHQLFQIASIFAANINGKEPNHPTIHLNDRVQHLLSKTTQVRDLQNKGIQVLLTLLGNHQNAGWSCVTEMEAAQNFAEQVVNLVNLYKLDGIDIDDEYSTCQENKNSLIMMAQAIKKHPKFHGKLLNKALFRDKDFFRANFNNQKLADLLDFGWEMSYELPLNKRGLDAYEHSNMPKNSLLHGVWTNETENSIAEVFHFVKKNHYGGVMVFNLKKDSQPFLRQLVRDQTDEQGDVDILPNCLLDH